MTNSANEGTRICAQGVRLGLEPHAPPRASRGQALMPPRDGEGGRGAVNTTSLHSRARLQHTSPSPVKAQELKTRGSLDKTPAQQQGAGWRGGAQEGRRAQWGGGS